MPDAPQPDAARLRELHISPREREVLAYLQAHGACTTWDIHLPGYERGSGPSHSSLGGTINSLARRSMVVTYSKQRGGRKRWTIQHKGAEALAAAGGPPPLPDIPRRSLTEGERAIEALIRDTPVGEILHMDTGYGVLRWEHLGDGAVRCLALVTPVADRVLDMLHAPDTIPVGGIDTGADRVRVARRALDHELSQIGTYELRPEWFLESPAYVMETGSRMNAPARKRRIAELRAAEPTDLSPRTSQSA